MIVGVRAAQCHQLWVDGSMASCPFVLGWLAVDNDGCALAPPSRHREGMGFRSRRHGGEILGGIFEWIAAAGAGVRTRCAVPLASIAIEAGS